MQTRTFSWHTLYLRWAGLFSAIMGLVSFWVLILAFRETDPQPKLFLAIVGFVGAFVGYAIGKDIMDRIRNQEASGEFLSTQQTRLAFVGTRFGFALSQLVLLLALASIVFFSIPLVERFSFFCGSLPKVEGSAERCLRTFFGYP
jgi:hydrogenase/urease accessory protein HupE